MADVRTERRVRIAVVVVNLFAAASAFAGAVGLLVGYMDIPLSVLRTTPFADFTLPALLLGGVVGGSALGAAAFALAEPRIEPRIEPLRADALGLGPVGIGALASAIAGCVMVGWMTVELAMIGLGAWVQVLYLLVGLVMVGLALLLQWAEFGQVGVHSLRHAA